MLCGYLSVAHRLEQEQQDGFEMLVPHLQSVFANKLEQLTQRCLPLLDALVVIGQLLQQLGHQLRLVQAAVCWDTVDKKKVSLYFYGLCLRLCFFSCSVFVYHR